MKNIVVRIVTNNLGGGARIHCYQLNKALEENNIHTVTFIPKAPFPDTYSDREFVGMEYYHNLSFWKILHFCFKNRKRIRYIHTHLRKSDIIGLFISKILFIPHIITIHFPYQNKLIISCLHRVSILLSSKVIFISEFIKSFTTKQLKLVNNEKYKVIYNGSNQQKIINNMENIESISFCVVGELTTRKGLLDLEELFLDERFHSNLRKKVIINIYGEGHLVDFLYKLERLSNEKLELNVKGYEKDTSKIFLNNNFNLALSYGEAFGRTLTEAMSYGLKNIARNDGAFREIVLSENEGYLFDDVDDLKRIIELLSEKSESVCRDAVLNSFNARFTTQIFTKNTILFIEN
ncbi:glycosyltransferase family 4 protein [Vibrio parahaemolyticus]|uniref:glycosyltransferase family 4 protein n=2 Tax=Vibrio parahaemolyticus TaxID=670 RepID=UPI00215CD339|nr:glycosyltransferase family 4 protein [Vibrio parahaemolyticus]MCR9946325.1 glycosyltransferase family 4 protein [Vibrio parahaemolyticus]MCR9995818.1 glycosyltransferase family 4 protein [Vibrio parahaemolyticus]